MRKKILSFLNLLRPIDFLLIIVSLAIAVVLGILVYSNAGGTERLIVEAPQGVWLYDLHENTRFKVPGMIGNTEIEIQDGKVKFIDSPCSNKTCIHAPSISENLQWIVCLPNQVFARIESQRPAQEIDVMAK